jgi:hypothetical protein
MQVLTAVTLHLEQLQRLVAAAVPVLAPVLVKLVALAAEVLAGQPPRQGALALLVVTPAARALDKVILTIRRMREEAAGAQGLQGLRGQHPLALCVHLAEMAGLELRPQLMGLYAQGAVAVAHIRLLLISRILVREGLEALAGVVVGKTVILIRHLKLALPIPEVAVVVETVRPILALARRGALA